MSDAPEALLPDAVVRYAPHDDGLVDVHLPPPPRSSRAPLLVLLHGGFWKQTYDRRHTRPLARTLAGEGYVVVTPEYRRVGGAGGWPTTAEDVEDAVTAAPGLLRGLGVATGSVTILGHSAGGHLALWLANQPLPLDLVVGLAPVADLRTAARTSLGNRATQALLGGEPDEVPDRYDAADPMIRFTTRPACDVRVVHGTADADVPLAISEALAETHPFVNLRTLRGPGHMDLVDPASAAWSDVLAALTDGRHSTGG
jgi:acetyl esterase/lipase